MIKKRLLDFFFPVNDWIVIYVIQGKWMDAEGYIADVSVYETMYSESRNRYKLKISGHSPKQHTEYKRAVDGFYQLYYNSKQGWDVLKEAHEILNNK